MQERKKIKISTKNLRIGFVGLEFSKRILSKYTFFRKSGRLPALIFLKLFSNKIESRKIKPYPDSKSIINYFRFHLSFYFGIVRKSMGISGGNPMEHMSYIIEFVEPHLQLSENEQKRGVNSVKKIGFKKYSTGSLEKKKALEFLKFKISGRSEISTSIRSQYVLNNSTAGKQLNFNFFPEFSYLDMFHHMMLHMHYKPMNNYGNILISRNKEIKDINYFQAPGSDRHDSSYHFSYLMTGPAKIALSPATSGYLQRNRHIENAGSIRYNDASPVVMQKMNKQLSISGSLPGPAKVYSAIDDSAAVKTENLPIIKNRKIPDLRNEHTPGSYLHASSYHFSYLMTGPAKIALSPAASGYLQRSRHLENTGSIRYNVASPAVMRKMNKEFSFSGSLPVKLTRGYSAMDNSAALNTDNLPMMRNRIIQDIRNEHTPGSDMHASSYHFSYLMTGPARIALSPAASGYLQRSRHLENTGSENISIVRLNGQNKNLNFRNLTGNNTYNPSELVIKKTSIQETENVARNTQEKTTSTRITDHSIKDSIGERPINEINRIADRVYHIIERKISIEKDRRGLL